MADDPLVNALVQRELLKASDYYSSNVPDTYAVRKPLSMLHALGVELPTHIVTRDAKTKDLAEFMRRSPVQHNMGINPNEPGQPLRVNTWTRTYLDAMKDKPNALRQLAAQFAHEAQHQRVGADEDGAYGAQLRALQALGGTNDELKAVQNALAYVRRTQGQAVSEDK